LCVRHAKKKELEYISRCQSYLHFTKKIKDLSSTEFKKRQFEPIEESRLSDSKEKKYALFLDHEKPATKIINEYADGDLHEYNGA